jgi:D-alanyl-D-alanine carboxypeptidase
MRLPIFLLISACLTAGNARADRLDDTLTSVMQRRHIPGLSVLVIKDGKIIKEKGYGLANVEHDVPVTPKTVFQSASVGKQFTAALVMLLAEDGKLSLDDPISRHLSNTPKSWEGITIRHLLTHTSGLGDPYAKLDFHKDYTDEELVALEATIPVLFAPGERWAYSNMGYHLLGFICNKAGGKFYGDQLRERIFAPLGMSTRVISESDIVPHRAAGYEWANGKLKNQDWVAPRLNTTADGSLYLTARDLALWDQALYGNKILNARIREAIWTPVKLNNGTTEHYGYGWDLSPRNGHRSISHGGSWQGFKSYISRFVDDKLTVIVLANSATAQPAKFANLIAAHYMPALAVEPPKPIADSDPAITARVQDLVSRLTAGEPPTGLSEKEAARYTPAVIKDAGDALRQSGPLRSVALLSLAGEGESRRFRYRFMFKDDTLIVFVQLDKADKIERLGIFPE